MNSALIRVAILCASCLLAQVAFADPPARDEPPRALQALKQARDKGLANPRAANANASNANASNANASHPNASSSRSTSAAPGGSLQVHDENPALAAMKAAASRARRDQARTARHQALVRQLAGREAAVQLRAELRTHARRVARLQRIRALAAQREPALLARIDDLITRENQRHEQRVKTLIDKAKPGRGAIDDEQDEEVEE